MSFEELYNMYLCYKRTLPSLTGKTYDLVNYFVSESSIILDPLKEKDGIIYSFLMDKKGVDINKIVNTLRKLRDTCQIKYETQALMGTCDAFRIYVEDILYGGELPVEEQSTFKFQHEGKIYV